MKGRISLIFKFLVPQITAIKVSYSTNLILISNIWVVGEKNCLCKWMHVHVFNFIYINFIFKLYLLVCAYRKERRNFFKVKDFCFLFIFYFYNDDDDLSFLFSTSNLASNFDCIDPEICRSFVRFSIWVSTFVFLNSVFNILY